VVLGDILFTKLGENGEEEGSGKGQAGKAKGMTAEEQKAAKDAKKAKNAKVAAEQQQKKAEKKSNASKAASKVSTVETEDQHDFTKIELRVGQITKVWHHETADK
jgi:hypothetical protein